MLWILADGRVVGVYFRSADTSCRAEHLLGFSGYPFHAGDTAGDDYAAAAMTGQTGTAYLLVGDVENLFDLCIIMPPAVCISISSRASTSTSQAVPRS